MSICDLKSYEIVQSRDLSDLSSKGTLLRHKKSGARVLLMENDDENKVLPSVFVHRRQTVQEFRILWSIPYSAGQRISRQRIHL